MCLPSDLLNLSPIDSDDLASLVPAGDTLLELKGAAERAEECKFECERVEYLSHVQYGRLDEEAVEDMEDADGDGDLVTVVQLFFETFHYERHSLKQDTVLEFMCK